MSEQRVSVAGIGWVLPQAVGKGDELLDRTEWRRAPPADGGTLAGFSARPYLSSVKGYLDPSGAFCLAAAALALGDHEAPAEIRDDAGISTVSRYGAPISGRKFFEQFLSKGAHFASPLLFPHSYCNTPGNLAAIEFGFGGPHMVFYGAPDVRDAFDFACSRLQGGDAVDMLVGAFEAVDETSATAETVPLNGSVVVWLTVNQRRPAVAHLIGMPRDLPIPSDALAKGSVDAMLAFLQNPGAVKRSA